MSQLSSVTSKLQLTLPISIARKVGIHRGQKVSVKEINGKIIITPMRALVEELAGSVEIPDNLKGIDIDQAIEMAKETYFKEKYHKRKDK